MLKGGFPFRAKRFAALMTLVSVAGIPMAGQRVNAARSQRARSVPKKDSARTDAGTDAASAPPVTAPAPQPIVSGKAVGFSVPPAAEFLIQVPEKTARLKLDFHLAGPGVNAFLSAAATAGGSSPEGHSYREVVGETSIEVLPQSYPPLRPGTYLLKLESDKPAGGTLVATAVPAAVRQPPGSPEPPSPMAAFLLAPPPWLAAALSVASLACLGLLFLHGIRSARQLGGDITKALDNLQNVLVYVKDIKKSNDNLSVEVGELLRRAEASPDHSQDQAPAFPLARLQLLLENEPVLVTARLVRDVARRAGGEAEKEFSRNFGGYLAALDRAERLLLDPARLAEPEEEWSALHRAIGALQVRHNPRFFLDVVDEAGRQGMPQKDQLLQVLGLEEISPPAGQEIVDLSSYQVERTHGMGRRSILDRVLCSGYRSRETGEMYRKPAIAVRLESDYTAAV